MPLKQSQGHQTCNKNVDPRQGYNHAKFERFHFDSLQEKDNIEVLRMRKYANFNYLPWPSAKIKNSSTVMIYRCNQQP